MHELIAWSGFVGAWLLVAGPLFQAAVELDEQAERGHGVSRASTLVDPPPPLSPWWWLLPPVAYVKQRRRVRDHRQAVLDALTADEVEGFVALSSVATGWALVASGAFFIALKETYELVEAYDWPTWLLPVVALAMVAACAASTVVRVRRAHALVAAKRRPTDVGATA